MLNHVKPWGVYAVIISNLGCFKLNIFLAIFWVSQATPATASHNGEAAAATGSTLKHRSDGPSGGTWNLQMVVLFSG